VLRGRLRAKVLCNAEDQLAPSKAQIIALKKKLEEAEKAREQVEKAQDQVEQEGYDVGVVKTEEVLRAEITGVCRNNCSQVWYETLNQAGIKASSMLRKAESVYYPLPSKRPFPLARGLIPYPRWQKSVRTAQPMFLPLLATPPWRPSSSRSQKKKNKRMQTREWPLMP